MHPALGVGRCLCTGQKRRHIPGCSLLFFVAKIKPTLHVAYILVSVCELTLEYQSAACITYCSVHAHIFADWEEKYVCTYNLGMAKAALQLHAIPGCMRNMSYALSQQCSPPPVRINNNWLFTHAYNCTSCHPPSVLETVNLSRKIVNNAQCLQGTKDNKR